MSVLRLAALADPTRARIIEILAAGELSSTEIANRFKISAPAISQHLKILKEARFVRARVDAQRRIYQLEATGFTELESWLAGIRRFWSGRLNDLETELRKTTGRKKRRKRRSHKKGSKNER